MRLIALLLTLLVLTGCASAPVDVPASEGEPPATAPTIPPPVPPLWHDTRDEVRHRLLQIVNDSGLDGVKRLFEGYFSGHGDGVPWLEVDLDGDGERELVGALPVRRGEHEFISGALFVVHQQDGVWAVDRTEPRESPMEFRLGSPVLFAAADVAGLGRPQVLWSRPSVIATGPPPSYLFATVWEPGSLADLPGTMAISYMRFALDGSDLLLSGMSRTEWIIRTDPLRTDRYRFVNGAFTLVDRRFQDQGEYGYDRLWSGLVAEEVGRTADALADYAWAGDPQNPAHPGSIWQRMAPEIRLSLDDLERFGEALRTFAHFREGALLLGEGRQAEARAALSSGDGPYSGLLEAMRRAADRNVGCVAAASWAKANPAFLEALNLGVGHSPWVPELLCTHMPLEEDYVIWQ